MNNFEEIITDIPKEIKTLEVDAEKKIFKVNGIDFGKVCEGFSIAFEEKKGFKIKIKFSKRIVYANYGLDYTLESDPWVISTG